MFMRERDGRGQGGMDGKVETCDEGRDSFKVLYVGLKGTPFWEAKAIYNGITISK